jgi:rhomboid protease GluP
LNSANDVAILDLNPAVSGTEAVYLGGNEGTRSMEKRDGPEISAGPWEAFALGSIAALGPFSQVHLAPRIPPAALTSALRAYLSLQGDELLLALIDTGGGTLDGCCALTTRRVYWTALDAAGQDQHGTPGPGAPASRWNLLRALFKRTDRAKWRFHVLRYGQLPEVIREAGSAQRVAQLDLGTSRPLSLPSADPRLSRALARYLETMGAAARSGSTPPLLQLDPELADRVTRVIPAVVEATAQTRAHYRDLLEFRRALFSATPHRFMTPAFALGCLAVFLAMVATGVPAVWPRSGDLIPWGANSAVRVILRHEYWRLLASVFVHGGLIHLAVNMWCLVNIGPLVERLYGNLTFAAVYLASGIGGAIASIAVNPSGISVGASGAIFGVLGALLAFLVVHRHSIPRSLLRPLRASAVGFVVFNTIFGLVVPNIDQAAHMGGLATGFVAGLLLSRPWPVVASGWLAIRRLASSALIAAALAGLAVAATHRGNRTISRFALCRDFVAQIAPAWLEFDEIRRAMPDRSDLLRERGDPRASQLRLKSLHDLCARAASNLDRLRQATTPDPELRHILDLSVRGQTSLNASLESAGRFLADGDLDHLEGSAGMRARRREFDSAAAEFYRLLRAYLARYNLTPGALRSLPGSARAWS